MLSGTLRTYLLNVVRTTIAARLAGEAPPDFEVIDEALSAPAGVFVTLHKNGELRGCIGYVEAVKPLLESVVDMAHSAAFRDPRFPQVTERELSSIDIEITVLSPLKPAQPSDVEVGRHGIVVTKGHNRGLLLPQVATENNWDRDTFISHTCMKAGLLPDAWKKGGVTLETFEGEVFGEKEHR